MTTNSPSRTYSETATCPKCGRQYPKYASSMRLQYFCSYCGSDIYQEQIRPLLTRSAISKPDNHTKNVGVLLTSLLLLTTLIIAYFTVINPDASHDPDHLPLNINTTAPSVSPTAATLSPTTSFPTENTPQPTSDPTTLPTIDPTIYPTLLPTFNPTLNPTKTPTIEPTGQPTVDPTKSPSEVPTKEPTHYPTTDPTINPTSEPTTDPTKHPTDNPTLSPTHDPTIEPTQEPTPIVINKGAMTVALTVGGGGLGLIVMVLCIFVVFKARESKYSEMIGAVRRKTGDEVSRNYSEIREDKDDNETVSGVYMT